MPMLNTGFALWLMSARLKLTLLTKLSSASHFRLSIIYWVFHLHFRILKIVYKTKLEITVLVPQMLDADYEDKLSPIKEVYLVRSAFQVLFWPLKYVTRKPDFF